MCAGKTIRFQSGQTIKFNLVGQEFKLLPLEMLEKLYTTINKAFLKLSNPFKNIFSVLTSLISQILSHLAL